MFVGIGSAKSTRYSGYPFSRLDSVSIRADDETSERCSSLLSRPRVMLHGVFFGFVSSVNFPRHLAN